MHDVAIIGAGPAGLSAAIALACEGKQVVLLDKADFVGGQIAHSHLVENVPGYRHGFNGAAFSQETYAQAIGLGVDIRLGHQVVELLGWPGKFGLLLHNSGMVGARSVLITTGVAPRPLPFDTSEDCCFQVTNELQLLPASEDEHVVVYGGGNSAGQAACYYAKQGARVTLLSRRAVEETMDGRWIGAMLGLGVDLIVGEINHASNNTVVFWGSGEVQQLVPHTLHAFTGGEPTTSWLNGWVELDDRGYIITDQLHCTSTYGIFAAGDCESGSVKKFTCAVGGACEAVPAIGQYLLGV